MHAPPALLTIVADDYGYARRYDEGIVVAAARGAIDAVSAMALRMPDPAPLLETGVEIGLHLELDAGALADQIDAFTATFAAPPAFLDGHHHCHAQPLARARAVARVAIALGIPVRSVEPGHRRMLRDLGVATADRLAGRLDERDPAMPAEIAAWLAGEAPSGTTEWMVHPGRPDAATGSTYDRGRGDDLSLLLELGDRERWRERGIVRGPQSLWARSHIEHPFAS